MQKNNNRLIFKNELLGVLKCLKTNQTNWVPAKFYYEFVT